MTTSIGSSAADKRSCAAPAHVDRGDESCKHLTSAHAGHIPAPGAKKHSSAATDDNQAGNDPRQTTRRLLESTEGSDAYRGARVV
jgi:hypothetical protein